MPPEYNYWQKKHMYGQMNQTAAKKSTAERQRVSRTIKAYVPPKVSIPEDKDEHIRALEALLYDGWCIIFDLRLGSTHEQKARAFSKLDRKMRELGVLPSKPKPKKK